MEIRKTNRYITCEVFGVWTNLATNYGLIAGYQTFYNHTDDYDLQNILEDTQNFMNSMDVEFGTETDVNQIRQQIQQAEAKNASFWSQRK